MKLNVDQVVNDVEGKPRKNIVPKVGDNGLPLDDGKGGLVLENKGDFLVKDALYIAVNAVYKDENVPPTGILSRGKLARKIKHGGERSFSVDEVKLLCELVSKRYQGDPELVLTLTELLDPDQFKVDAPAAAA